LFVVYELLTITIDCLLITDVMSLSNVSNAGMEVEGVYRLSGQNSKVAQLLKCCRDGQTLL